MAEIASEMGSEHRKKELEKKETCWLEQFCLPDLLDLALALDTQSLAQALAANQEAG